MSAGISTGVTRAYGIKTLVLRSGLLAELLIGGERIVVPGVFVAPRNAGWLPGTRVGLLPGWDA